MTDSHWQLDMWREAGLEGRKGMLDLDEAEPTYLAGCALGNLDYLDGLTRVEADELIAHALTIAMQRLEATLVIHGNVKRSPSMIIHSFCSPAWIRELEEGQPHRLSGPLDGVVSGFVRSRSGSHSAWKSSIDELGLDEITSKDSVVTVWNWPVMRNLADLTHAESEWKEMRIAD